MKLKVQQEEKKFEPMKLELTLETIEEARLMWHILNRNRLKEAIFSENYSTKRSSHGVASQFDSSFTAWKNLDDAFETKGYTL
jgi:hypothetical protein